MGYFKGRVPEVKQAIIPNVFGWISVSYKLSSHNILLRFVFARRSFILSKPLDDHTRCQISRG